MSRQYYEAELGRAAFLRPSCPQPPSGMNTRGTDNPGFGNPGLDAAIPLGLTSITDPMLFGFKPTCSLLVTRSPGKSKESGLRLRSSPAPGKVPVL